MTTLLTKNRSKIILGVPSASVVHNYVCGDGTEWRMGGGHWSIMMFLLVIKILVKRVTGGTD